MPVKRGNTWHADFCLDGIRYRQSLQTSDWREGQNREKDLIAEARLGKLHARTIPSGKLPFRTAAAQFISDPVRDIRPLSRRTETERSRAVSRVLGDRPVKSLTTADVLGYIARRREEGRAAATINRELDLLRGVLKRAKRWHLFVDEIRPLALPESIGRVLSLDEKLQLLRTAASRPEWQSAHSAAVLTLNTTMRACEVRGLRWRDVDLLDRSLRVQQSKSRKGVRILPLNADAMEAMTMLYQRAKQLGASAPDHYVFFACEHGHFDPERPQRSWRTAWRRITRLISCPVCGMNQDPDKTCAAEGCAANISKVRSHFAGLRFHDLRHQAITELAESQASDRTIRDIAGHVSNRMLEHYSHIRMGAKRAALDAIATKPTARGYDTTTATNCRAGEDKGLDVIEKMVELVGIEPTTSSLRTMRSPS